MQPINVLIATDIPYPATGFGVATMTELHLNALQRAGCMTIVLSREDISGEQPYQKIDDKLVVFRYPNPSGRKGAIELYKLVKASQKIFYEIVDNIRIDVIVFEQPLVAYSLSLPHKSDIPAVYMYYSSWYEEHIVRERSNTNQLFLGVGAWVRKRMERKAIERSKYICLLSNYSQENIRNIHRGLDKEMHIVPGGVNIDKFKPSAELATVRNTLNLKEDVTIFLTVRNLVPRMGLDKLITAMSMVKQRFQNKRGWKLLIGGSGPLRDELEMQVVDLNLQEEVSFPGFITDELLPLYYQASDAFILPTQCMEGFGLVTIESLACGTPVLGTPVGATPEILGKLSPKLLFDSAEPEAMADGIERFLTYRQDFPTSEECRDFVISYYDMMKVGDRFAKLVKNVASSKTSPC